MNDEAMAPQVQRDIIFLFGAGASYGAGSIMPEPPPLGSQLYPILAEIYPSTWGALPHLIKDVFRINFEEGMQKVYDQYGEMIPMLMRELGIYFMQFRPYEGSSLYSRLISDLSNISLINRVQFSTLNYECVLEFSILGQGLDISYFKNGPQDSIPVWKLHGSCNMLADNLHVGQEVQYGTGVIFEGGLKADLDSNRVIGHLLTETGLSPAMCLYMRGKPLQVSPSVIKDIQSTWAQAIRNSKVIVCVGVRPWPEDKHIWEPIALTNGYLYFVGSEPEFMVWSKKYRSTYCEYLGARFNEAYTRILRRIT